MLDAVMGPLDGDAPNLESPPFLGACAVNLREGNYTKSLVSAYFCHSRIDGNWGPKCLETIPCKKEFQS